MVVKTLEFSLGIFPVAMHNTYLAKSPNSGLSAYGIDVVRVEYVFIDIKIQRWECDIGEVRELNHNYIDQSGRKLDDKCAKLTFGEVECLIAFASNSIQIIQPMQNISFQLLRYE